eukprot:Tbor_TRINITY_DN3209_c0_g1::TRINITY_DN3209_c0_g1_i1::g.23790::m.23790
MSTTNAHEGRLITFHNDPYLRIPIFLSGSHNRCIVWLGGQCDGLFVSTYMPQLISESEKAGWSLAQLMPSSSYIGHGAHTHVQDAEDLNNIIQLLGKEHKMKEITLFASSTAIQIAMEFMGSGEHAEMVTRVVLQGVVCNPTAYLFTEKGEANRMARANKLVDAGRGEEMREMREAYDIPVTAARVAGGGLLSMMEAFWIPAHREETQQLAQTLVPIRVPLLIMISLGVNYKLTDEDKIGFEKIMKNAASTSELVIEYFEYCADENRRILKALDAVHTNTVISFIRDQDSKRDEQQKQEAIEMALITRANRSILANSSFSLV